MNIDWTPVFTIVSPTLGDFPLNTDIGGGRQYKLNPKRCVGRRGIRATVDDIPQGDGEIFHERYAKGSELQLAIQLWETNEACACDDVLVEMYDDLRGVLWSLLRPANDGGRVIWAPAGKTERMIDAARLLQLNDPEEDADTGCTEILVVIDTPFPYAISLAQDLVVVNGTQNIPNGGNVEFWPVIKVNSGGSTTTEFTIETSAVQDIFGNNLKIEWDASFGVTAIGAGDYAEIDTFKGTMFLNGNQDDLSGGLVATTSDFFPIIPGDNSVSAIGSGGFTDATFLMNDAFA